MLYKDTWMRQIPENKLAAYKSLIDEGQIKPHNVIVYRSTGVTTVEYYAEAPQEWIHEELHKRSEA